MDFEQAYDENVGRVYGFFAYRTGSRGEAEDLTQQTFERAWRAWARFDPHISAASTWLLSIAHNLLIDHHRARAPRGHEVPLDAVHPESLGSVNGTENGVGLDPGLALALSTLRVREREIIALRYGGDLRSPEIARLLGLSVSNVQQITSRTLRRLREELEQ